MRYIFWNIRGCGHSGRRTQLREYIAHERIDVVALQETIKADFSYRDLAHVIPFIVSCGAGFPPVVIRVVFFWDVIVMYVML